MDPNHPQRSVALFALHVRGTDGAPLPWDVLSVLLDAVAVQCWGHWMPLLLVQRLQAQVGTNRRTTASTASPAIAQPLTKSQTMTKTKRKQARAFAPAWLGAQRQTARLAPAPLALRAAPHGEIKKHITSDTPAPPVLTLRVLCDLWQCQDAVPSSITREALQHARLLQQVW